MFKEYWLRLYFLATIFGRVLLRSTTKSLDYYRDTRCREFMQRFVTTGSEMGTLSSSASSSSSSTSSNAATANQLKLPSNAAASSTHTKSPSASKRNIMETT